MSWDDVKPFLGLALSGVIALLFKPVWKALEDRRTDVKKLFEQDTELRVEVAELKGLIASLMRDRNDRKTKGV